MVADISLIQKYFNLDERQTSQLTALGPLYKNLNEQVNVVSRKDIDALYLHHVLHSLSIMNFIDFIPGTKILDLGTGGGFPGIPLAIMFPECQFLLIDGTAKKIKVVNEVIEHCELDNVKAIHKRSEELKMKFDFVLARAVTRLNKLIPMCSHLFAKEHINVLPNGLITLKGGDLTEEIAEVSKQNSVEQVDLSKYFTEPYFETKSLLYIQG